MLGEEHVWFSETDLVTVQSLRTGDLKCIFKLVEMQKNMQVRNDGMVT